MKTSRTWNYAYYLLRVDTGMFQSYCLTLGRVTSYIDDIGD